MNSRFFKRMLLLLCLMLLAGSMLTMNVSAAGSGTCGDNATWTLDDNGVLTISGTGAMKSYCSINKIYGVTVSVDYISKPWEVSEVTKLVVEEGITNVGGAALWRVTGNHVTSVSLADSVKSIGHYAFYNSHSLTSITLPSGISYIGEYAFEDSANLATVTFEGSAPNIASNAFTGVTATCYYPPNDSTWTSEIMQNYGGTLTWVEFDPCGGNHTYGSDNVCTVCNKVRILYSGTCGDDLTWILDANGKLTISGTGAMDDYAYRDNYAPWYDYKENILLLSVENGVTAIGDYAFRECANLLSAEIADTVSSIGSTAFWNCSNLADIEIPESVTQIGDYAFCNCTSITTIVIPSGVAEIIENTFNGCSGLIHIEIPESVTTIYGYAFRGCSNLWHVAYTGTQDQWDQINFTYGNTSLTNARLHTQWTDSAILDIANKECSECEPRIKINMTDTGANGWGGNRILVYVDGVLTHTVTLSSGSAGSWTVEYEPEKTYRFVWGKASDNYSHEQCGCSILLDNDVLFNENYTYFTNCFDGTQLCIICDHDWQEATCTTKKTCTKCGATEGNVLSHTYDQEVTDEAYLKSEATCTSAAVYYYSCACGATGEETFSYGEHADHTRDDDHKCTVCGHIGGNWGDNLTWELDEDGVLTFYGTGDMALWNGVLENYRSNVKAVVISDGVTSIGDWAFEGCSSLTEITIPDSVTSIGYGAFISCSSLTEITIPDSVTSISAGTFYGCSSLTEITIPDSVTSIDGSAFYDCSSLTEIHIPDSVTSIGDSAFNGCSSLTEIAIPNGVTSIESETFCFCSSLKEIVIPDSITSIGMCAFDSCNSLTEITIPASVTSIASEAFVRCKSLTDVYYGGDVNDWTELGENVPTASYIHYNCTSAENHWTQLAMEADCENAGYTSEECACGYERNKVETDAAFGHHMGDWIETKTATCTEDGEKARSCERENCDHTEIEAIEATGHTHTSVVTAPTCTDRGYTTHTCACDDSYVDSYEDALGHDMGDWTVTEEATCTEDGEKARSCEREGCDHTETEVVEATGHTHTSVVTAPTCTDRGYTTHTCACDDSYVDSYEDALGHDMGDWTVTKEATCTENGEKARSCERDGCDHTETEVVEATGHTHTSVVTAPTCTEKGYTTHTCACGDSYVDSYGDALGHKMGEWTVVSEPTAAANGEERRECSRCEHYESREIAYEETAPVSVNGVTVSENEDGSFTAVADVTGGSGFYAYNYWLFDSTGTIVDRHENTFDTSWTFEKPADGIYLMRIYATDFTTESYNDSSWFAVTSPYENVAVSNVTVVENEDGTYTATANVTGGNGFYAYNYWLFDANGTIVDRHENTFDTSWTFEKPADGIYLMRIYATDFTTDAYNDSSWFAVTSPYENVAVSNVTVTVNEDGTYTATADVTGSSGFFAFNYWLFDSTGTIVDRHENTFDTSWTFEKPENGIYLMRIYATDFTTDSHGDGPWFAVAD